MNHHQHLARAKKAYRLCRAALPIVEELGWDEDQARPALTLASPDLRERVRRMTGNVEHGQAVRPGDLERIHPPSDPAYGDAGVSEETWRWTVELVCDTLRTRAALPQT